MLRAAWGLFYDLVPTEVSTVGMPYRIQEEPYTNPLSNPDVIFPRVFPNTGAGPKSVALPVAANPGLRTPYSMQFNLTVELRVWNTGFRASYGGTNTRKGEYAYNYNAPEPDERLCIEKPRPFPQYGGINYLTNGAGHQYDALTPVTGTRRLTRPRKCRILLSVTEGMANEQADGPCAGHFGPVDPEDFDAGADAWLGDRAADPADVE